MYTVYDLADCVQNELGDVGGEAILST